MNNLDKMKQFLAKEIEKMSVQDFEYLTDVIYDDEDINVDRSFIFHCAECLEKYGECDESDDERCHKRFRSYCLMETE